MSEEDLEQIEVDRSDEFRKLGLEPGEPIYEFHGSSSFTYEDIAQSAMCSALNSPRPIEIRRPNNARSFYMVVATIKVVYIRVVESEREEIGSDYYPDPEFLLTGWLYNPLQPVFDPGQEPNARCFVQSVDGLPDTCYFQRIPEKPEGEFECID